MCLGAINTLFQSPLMQAARRVVAPALARFGSRDALMHGLFVGSGLRPQSIREALARREQLIEQIERFLQHYDVWLCPVFPTPAFAHCAPNAPIMVYDQQMPQLSANLLHSIIFNDTTAWCRGVVITSMYAVSC